MTSQQPQASTAAEAAAAATPDAWLANDAGPPVPVATLLAYAPTDHADAERYCLALYHQMEGVPARDSAEFDTLWTRTSQLDPERRLLKAAHDLSLLDVCYETLRHANLFGRWVRPRPRLAKLVDESRCLRAYYDESATKSAATTFTTPAQYVKSFVRNLLLSAFLFWTLGFPTKLFPVLLSTAMSMKVIVEVVAIAVGLCVALTMLRLLFQLPRSPSLLVNDPYSAAILRSGPLTVLWRSIIADMLDEILHRWMGVNCLAFLLSLLDLAMTKYVGSFVMIAAVVGVVSERCSLRAILIVAGLACLTVYGQLSNISLLWSLGSLLRFVISSILSKLSSTSLDASTFSGRPDLLTALVLSTIRLPTTLTLKPWRFADFFLEPCQMIISSLFWNIVLSHGLLAALIARFAFSIVSGLLFWMLQGPVSFDFVGKAHQE